MATSPRYAPAREDGTRPYVVTVAPRRGWTAQDERLVYAPGTIAASYAALARDLDSAYVAALRRASPEDVTNLKEYR